MSVFIVSFLVFSLAISPRQIYAASCSGCTEGDAEAAVVLIELFHQLGEKLMRAHISDQFEEHRDWLVEDFFLDNLLRAMMMFTEQMSAVAVHQVAVIGTFLDAKHQLETQQLFQQLQLQAHKDYHPSEDFCWFGTNVRSLAFSEARSRYTARAMSSRALSRHLGNANASSARNRDQDKEGRWRQFTSVYCDPKDNNWDSDATGSGLVLACQRADGTTGGADKDRRNRDIDYGRLVDEPRNMNFSHFWSVLGSEEEDMIALASNLYGHNVLTRNINEENLKNKQAQHLYLTLRSVAAKRSVAENSFNAIVGLKSDGSTPDEETVPPAETEKYLGAILKELGMSDGAVTKMMGFRPSYYLQLEVLAKRIYQNPDFYANLYDKPANVARKKVALQAIELMLDRAIYESQIRQEMVMSVLLSSKLREDFRDVNKDMVDMTKAGN